MLLSALQRLPLVAAAATRNPDDIPVMIVVLIGISLVFAILLILILVIVVEGKIFSSIEKKKQSKQADSPPPAAAVPAPAPVAAAVPAPAVEQGIPPEVVAAIVAAVDTATNGAYTLRAVTTAKKGRGAWGLAGVIQSTEPF